MTTSSDSSIDPQGYYEVLRLKPGAGPESVQAAYDSLLEEWKQCRTFSRFPVQEAYRVLSDPAQKASYDASSYPTDEEETGSKTRRILLFAIMTTLCLHVGFVFPGFLKSSPGSFHYRDFIVRSHDQTVLGAVVRRETNHRFPRGRIANAYLMRLEDGAQRWYPAAELEKHYSVKKDGRVR